MHLLTYFNGAAQGLTVFRTGLAKYEGVQEGLGVFAEWAVGGCPQPACAFWRAAWSRSMQCSTARSSSRFTAPDRNHGLRRKAAFDVTTRVFRSGGFAKDLIISRDFRT